MQGEEVYERYMLYGVDRMILNDLPIETNLGSINKFSYLRVVNKLYKIVAKKIIGSHGDITWVSPVLSVKKKYDIIFAFSEKCIYPVLFLRFLGILRKKKIILISIGLSEKLQLLTDRGAIGALNRLLREIKGISKIVTFSWHEKNILTNHYHLDNVIFIPLGVDVNVFRSGGSTTDEFDIVSIGADKNRDFDLLIKVAEKMHDRKFLLITSKYHADNLRKKGIPDNVKLKVNIPIDEVCSLIDSSKIVFLPVKENLYSGATTCLLQAMSLEKAVITTYVTPISKGYGLEDQKNVVFVEPENIGMAVNVISQLLSDKKKLLDIGRAARGHVESHLTLDKMIDSLTEIVAFERGELLFRESANSH